MCSRIISVFIDRYKITDYDGSTLLECISMNDVSVWQYIVPAKELGSGWERWQQAVTWCKEHLADGNWRSSRSYFYFRYEQDALWFKLVWEQNA
mgnify:CR=1 FL=1